MANKLTKDKVLDMMLADTRIASWIRTEYRNMIDRTPGVPTPKEPDAKKAEPAKAD